MIFLQWNLRGVRANMDNLSIFVRENSADVVLLQETKLRGREAARLSGFRSFNRNVVCGEGQIAHGGVAILVRQGVDAERVLLDTPLQAVAVRLRLARVVTICSVYMQEKDRVSEGVLQGLIDQLGGDFVLVGDFNGHNPIFGHDTINGIGAMLEEIITKNDLVLFNNGEATHCNKRIGSWSALDLTLGSNTDWGDNDWFTLQDLGNSDHLPIIFELFRQRRRRFSVGRRFVEDKADWNLFQEVSRSIDIRVLDSSSIEDFTKAVIEVAERTIPKNSGKIYRRAVPWWSKEVAHSIKERKRALQRAKRNMSMENMINLKRATAKAKCIIRRAKQTCREALCESISPKTSIRSIFNTVKRLQVKIVIQGGSEPWRI